MSIDGNEPLFCHKILRESRRACGIIWSLKADGGRSESFGPREETAVDGVNNRLSTDLPTAKESSIETSDSVLAARNFVEFEIDVALCVRVQSNMNNMAILALALVTHIVLQFLDPAFSFFPVFKVSAIRKV